jgi:hypothetical protein
MTTRHLLLATMLTALFAPAQAQDTHADAARAGRAADGAVTFHFDALDHDARRGITTMHLNVVKNAPYTAQVVTERTQALADGNQIAVRRTTMTYRDSAGRTRQEIVNDKGELQTVTINDPVANLTWILKPQERVAIRIDRNRPAAMPPIERRKTPDGMDEVIVRRVERVNPDAHQRTQEDVRIQVPKAAADNGLGMRLAPLANAIDDARWSSKTVTKDLGSRDFGGIRAEGKLRSYEIPAGAIGNRNPIVVSDETWTAPDLQVTVYTRHSDPRSGDVVFRLENVKREEPAAALFTVPADYTVRGPDAHWRDKVGRADR